MADITVVRREYGLDIPVRYVDLSGGAGTEFAQKVVVVNPDGTPIAGGSGGYVTKATAAAPTYTEGSIVPLSVDLAGTLRTTAGAGGGGLADVQVRNGAGAWADVGLRTTDLRMPVETYVGTAAVDPRSIRALTSADQVTVANASLAVTGTFWQATQPVSGTVTANIGTTGGLALDATLTGRTQKTQVTDGVRDGTVKAASTAAVAADTALVVAISPNNSVAVTGTFWQATQPVSIAAAVDVSDRAARLVGVVYGSQAAQVKQTPTNFNTQVEVAVGATLIDPRSIRTLTTGDAVTAAQGAGAAAGTSWRVAGQQARASATVADPVIIGGRAATYPTKPTSVAAGQVVDLVADLEGVVYTRPRQVRTYVAVYRLALTAASSTLAFTFTANTDKQLATIYHAATSTKRVTIRRVWIQILKTGAVAGELQFELRTLSATTAPATGNPAITPALRDQSSGAAEATTLALPTTAGSEVAANSPIASSILNLAASVGTASGTGLLPSDPMWLKLYDEASADDEEIAPVMRAGVAEGYALVGRSTAAVPLNFIVRLVFTEE